MAEPLSVAIIPGFAEGQFHARRLKNALKAAGFTVIRDASEAGIIIGHSGGCYLVPRRNKAKAVIHIGYTYWPGRSLPHAARMKMTDEYRRIPLTRWLLKTGINTLYILKLRNDWRMYKELRNQETNLRNLAPGQIFIRNKADPYCQQEGLLAVAGSRHTFISFPDYHDHVWVEPEPYVNLLKSVV